MKEEHHIKIKIKSALVSLVNLVKLGSTWDIDPSHHWGALGTLVHATIREHLGHLSIPPLEST